MPLITTVFKDSGVSLISKVNKEMQIHHSKNALLVWEPVPWVAASNSSCCWETLERGGCVVLEKPVPQTGSWLCGQKAASLPSRLFSSKQEPSGGKQSSAAQTLGLGLFCEHSRSCDEASASWRNPESPFPATDFYSDRSP